jgi:hypothetical protein
MRKTNINKNFFNIAFYPVVILVLIELEHLDFGTFTNYIV